MTERRSRYIAGSEQDLVNAIISLITLRGGVAIRVNSGMIPIDNGDGTRRVLRGAPAGTADIIACYRGRFIAIECKIGRNKPTPLQVDFLERVSDAAGWAIVAYDVQTVIDILDVEDTK